MLFPPETHPRLVVKVGSALLVDASGAIRRTWLDALCGEIAERARAGQQIAIVSSGAIALGARLLNLPKGGRASLEDAQAAAATGQIALAGAWAELIGGHGLIAAQMLVTLDDLEDRRRYLNAAATLGRLLAIGVLPVINENDSVATEEIRFGDNDRLAARVATAAGASAVVLLSDVDGLYNADPTTNPEARHLARVDHIDGAIRAMASGARPGMGTGGMASKLAAAQIATSAGIPLAIALGRIERPLSTLDRHTLFVADKAASARKAWIAGGLSAAGSIHIDQGAARALRNGASLLAAGALRVEGVFARGDLVVIHGPDGAVARGLSEYDAVDAARLLGRPSDEHEALLGYARRAALVHRNHLALL